MESSGIFPANRGVSALTFPNGTIRVVHLFALLITFAAGCRHIDYASLDRRLIDSAKDGTTGEVKALLDSGAHVNARNESRRTVLMLAALKGRKDNVEVLLERGANIDETDDDKMTALMWAAFGGSGETVRALLKHGANPGARDARGETALDWAGARASNANVTRILKDAQGRIP